MTVRKSILAILRCYFVPGRISEAWRTGRLRGLREAQAIAGSHFERPQSGQPTHDAVVEIDALLKAGGFSWDAEFPRNPDEAIDLYLSKLENDNS